MDWQNIIRGRLTRRDLRERADARDVGTAQVEVLEERAVLGALAPLPTSSTSTGMATGPGTSAVATPPAAPQEQQSAVNFVPSSHGSSSSTVTTETGSSSFAAGESEPLDAPEDTTVADETSPPSPSANTTAGLNPTITLAPAATTADEPEAESSAAPPAVESGPPQEIDTPTSQADGGVFVDAQTMADHQYSITNIPWFETESAPVVIRYDFRSEAGVENEISAEQIAVVEQVLQAWSEATDGRITWVRDTEAADLDVVNIGVGDLSAVGYNSAEKGTLGVSKSMLNPTEEGGRTVIGAIWLDSAENWDNTIGNGNPEGTYDFFTVMAHEAGHAIGLADDYDSSIAAVMNPQYVIERNVAGIAQAFDTAMFFPMPEPGTGLTGYAVHNLGTGFPQLTQVEVGQLLDRASAASDTQDGIIAIVDRNGIVLGVRVEANVPIADPAILAFAIDGAIAKARTAAFFANDQAPLTSRTIRYISQSTVTEREVNANPNIIDPNSTVRGPGFVAPIGLGGHFPPDIEYAPPVDLFAIEHTNRDSFSNPGPDNIKGTADDIDFLQRFNINPAFVPAGQTIVPPLSYGEQRFGSADAAQAANSSFQSRGIATLPGGIPIYRDTDGNGGGDTLIGGIGVFFPGPDGFASFEQGYVRGVGQTTLARTNSDRTLEAEFIALAAIGGSQTALLSGAAGAVVGNIAGIPPVAGIDLPFGCLSLVGINLQVIGPTPGIGGVRDVVAFGLNNLTEGVSSGANQVVLGNGVTLQGGGVVGGANTTLLDGQFVAEGILVTPHNSAVDNLTAADVQQIIDNAVAAADLTRAAIRLDADGTPGARTKMVIAITDTTGEVLGLFRMQDATVFSIDVAVAKARNVAYYADAAELATHPEDQVPGVPLGTAFSNRTFRFLAEPRFPSGVDFSTPPVFSILTDAAAAGIDPLTGENLGANAPASVFDSVLGFDSFNPGTNFRDDDNLANRNGIVFFPGSTPLYKNGVLVGGLGISGDGVDQDDVVTFLAAQGFLPDGVTIGRADQVAVDGVRLPFQKFLRNPFA